MTKSTAGPLIADIDGIELTQVDREVLCHPKLGGLIFFSRNYESVEQLRDLVRCIREVRSDLVLCVDQEGGRVQRFKDGFTRLPAMGRILDIAQETSFHSDKRQSGAQTLAKDLGWLMASELTDLDIDHSFAPVLDLDSNRSKVIGDRAFSAKADVTIDLASAFIEGMAEAGMSATAKHFPGHGSVVADSHLELPEDPRSYEEIANHDLVPFLALKDNFSAVMTAHIAFSALDEMPVSFSRYWLNSILKDQMGFEGIIISDDLSMKGAAEFGTYQERSKLALGAGCDVILLCNQRREAERTLEFLESENLGEIGKLSALSRKHDFEKLGVDRVNDGKKRRLYLERALEQFDRLHN